jgi:1-deoxy-D-xylulose-5-phosphate synthase
LDIKNKNIKELENLAQEIRKKIIDSVSKNGGHLSSTLGAVDLIIGMHYVFDVNKDPFIFDVSHQAYAHKMLTDRWDKFERLRQIDGISGYTRPNESKYDYFSAGHSSTSISVAVGAAKAIKLKNEKRIPVAFIGDGSISAGMAYEALNELGYRKYPVVIILNDNEMSIGKPTGAISKYLTKMKAGRFYQGLKETFKKTLESMPKDIQYAFKKFDEMFAINGILFEEMGLEYIGPIDGHNLEEIIDTLQMAKKLNKPVVVHAKTIKGKGYKQAEGHFEHWHGVGPFDKETCKPLKPSSVSATKVFSDYLLKKSDENKKIVGVTAAMPSGTGMRPLLEKYPERFWDVAIAEQHAVTSMAPLAKEGFRPFVAIYSTFLQRGYDQIIHDVCIDKYPVIFAIDRAGLVGQDGETHQGLFDIGYLKIIPNITLFAPRCFKTLEYAMDFAINYTKNATAFRYPRGAFYEVEVEATPFEYGKAELLKKSKKIMLIGYGNGVGRAWQVMKLLEKEGIEAGVLDLRFIKPLDEELLKSIEAKTWFVFSDSAKKGGVAESLQSFSNEYSLHKNIISFEIEDRFVPHGNTNDIEKMLEIDVESLAKRVKGYING